MAPTQGVVEPVIAPGTDGRFIGVIDKQLGALVPQALTEETQILPVALPTVTLIEVVPCPELIVYPPGTVQIYEVAPETGAME